MASAFSRATAPVWAKPKAARCEFRAESRTERNVPRSLPFFLEAGSLLLILSFTHAEKTKHGSEPRIVLVTEQYDRARLDSHSFAVAGHSFLR